MENRCLMQSTFICGSADLTWENICLVRRPRGPSWHQSWVWWGASLGCSKADSAGCGWIQHFTAWAPSWPGLRSTEKLWDHVSVRLTWWVANHDEKLSLQEKRSEQTDEKCKQVLRPLVSFIWHNMDRENARSTTVDLAGWEEFHLNFWQLKHQSWCQNVFSWINCWKEVNGKR